MKARGIPMKTSYLSRINAPNMNIRGRPVKSMSCMATGSAGETVKIAWRMQYRVKFGENVRCVGGHDRLGNWNPERGMMLEWSEGDAWVGEAELQPEASSLEYKYVIVGSGNNIVSWKPGSNYVLDLQSPPPGSKVTIHDTWTWDGFDRSVKIEVKIQKEAQNDTQIVGVAFSPSTSGQEDGGPSTLNQIARKSLAELQDALALHEDVQRRYADPAAVEVLHADRLLAAVNKKAVAMNNALKAADSAAQLSSPLPTINDL